MKGNPAEPGGPAASKPAWPNTLGVLGHAGFFFGGAGAPQPPGRTRMNQSSAPRAQQIAQAAPVFEQRRTAHGPRSVSVVLGGATLVVTLRGVLSPAEQALAQSPAGAAQVQEFHRQLFASAAAPLRQKVAR